MMHPPTLSPAARRLEKRIQYSFRNPWLYFEALTHPSCLPEPFWSGNNQRLEFLGDAVLDLLVCERLFGEFGGLAEGALSQIKSTMVSEPVLAKVAETLELGPCLRMGPKLKPTDPMLADGFESLLGAIHLDSDMETCRRFRDNIYWPLAWSILGEGQLSDVKGTLMRKAQALGLPLPKYLERESFGPDHRRQFRIDVYWDGEYLATGEGHSKKSASVHAAQKALDTLKERGL